MTENTNSPKAKKTSSELPTVLKDAPIEIQKEYVTRKKSQFTMLMWLGFIMGGIFIVLKGITMLDPLNDPTDNIVFDILIVAAFIAAGFGNRYMAKKYAALEAKISEKASVSNG